MAAVRDDGSPAIRARIRPGSCRFGILGVPDERNPMLQAPRGTLDVLPEEQKYWRYVCEHVERWCARFGYERIDTPLFEDASLFRARHG